MSDCFDLLIIGGGVNGAGIARDAAGRGLSVIMVEKDDLAQGTSSRSGKLVHGGLRYLEYYEFRLVREALIEREVLLESAPHIIWPMRFVLPHAPGNRPAWLVRLGLFLYDHLGGRRKLPGTRVLDLRHAPEGTALRPEYTKAFEYSDCWVDDARLVILNALDAAQRGATILPRTACTSARREGDLWRVELLDRRSGTRREVTARAIVNAAGPWVGDVITRVTGANSSRQVRLVKGSHIIVPKFWDGPQGYLVQNHDRRVIFINPYEGDKALIGTTDIPYDGSPEDVAADEDEIAYLLDVVNRYFARPLVRGDVLESLSGVRPLYDDGAGNPSAVTRDYFFDLETQGPPILHVFGGKITTFRKLAEHAMQRLARRFPTMGGDWTAQAILPGGELPGGDIDAFMAGLARDYPWLPQPLLTHYTRLYGTRTRVLIGTRGSVAEMGQKFGPLLFEAEARFLIETEWAHSAEDILWRRTKHRLHMSTEQIAVFEEWLARETTKESV